MNIEHLGFKVTVESANWFIVQSDESDIGHYMSAIQLEQFAEKLTAIRLAAKYVGVDKNGRNVNL